MSTAVIPPFLVQGDTIGLVCPAGYMEAERTDAAQARLEGWGFRVRRGKSVGGNSSNYFSGTDPERLSDLQAMLDDKDVRAILCGRGGYGLTRIIDGIDFKKFIKHPKWILGYSDITLLHAHIYSRYKIASAHSPMAGAFNDGPEAEPFIDSLRQLLTGEPMKYEGPVASYSQRGEASGDLVGGNLTLLAHAIGTASRLKTKGRILFLEDIGEYKYNADRMLRQLKRSGALDKLAGLVVGHFTDMKDTTRPFGQPMNEIVNDVFSGFGYPKCFGFPVGHEAGNFALKHGVPHKLQVSETGFKLKELGR